MTTTDPATPTPVALVTAILPRRDGRNTGRLLRVRCPFGCQRPHYHGGGHIDEPIEDYLGTRSAHCRTPEARAYTLALSPETEITR